MNLYTKKINKNNTFLIKLFYNFILISITTICQGQQESATIRETNLYAKDPSNNYYRTIKLNDKYG